MVTLVENTTSRGNDLILKRPVTIAFSKLLPLSPFNRKINLSWHGQQAATDNNPACARGINLRDLIGLFGGKKFFLSSNLKLVAGVK